MSCFSVPYSLPASLCFYLRRRIWASLSAPFCLFEHLSSFPDLCLLALSPFNFFIFFFWGGWGCFSEYFLFTSGVGFSPLSHLISFFFAIMGLLLCPMHTLYSINARTRARTHAMSHPQFTIRLGISPELWPGGACLRSPALLDVLSVRSPFNTLL